MPTLLFSPYKLRDLSLPNRIVVSPMAQYSAEGGCATDWHKMHLGMLSVSGAGLLIVEATAVEPSGRSSPSDLGLWCDENAAALEPVLAFCRKHGGARLGLQLQHAGRKASVSVAWEKMRPLTREDGGWTIFGADRIPYPGRAVPIALDKTRMTEVVAAYTAATRRADELGIDLLEIHAAHGYLLHSFLSPLSNQRADEYGGSRENRMRFVLEVFCAVRKAWPERKPLGVRISATDWVEGGWDIDDSAALAKVLGELGCNYITASSGGSAPEQKITVYPGYQVPFAERIRQEVGLCAVAVGLITEPRQAEAILARGQADLVAIGRGMLFNPRWPWQAAMELGEEVFYPPQYERSHPSMRRGDFLKPARSV